MNHVTQAKRALKALLIDRLPGKLLQADLEAADGVKTPVPYETHTTDKNGLGGFPAIEIIATSSSPKTDSYAQVYENRVVVGFTLAGDDEETLSVQVERYMWAIRKIARDTLLAPDAIVGPIDSAGEQYTPLDNRPSGVEFPFVKGGYIELLMTTVE
jgi:hypothetical protein